MFQLAPNNKYRKNKTQTGGFLIEVLISIFIFSITTISVVYLVLGSGLFIKKEKNFTKAVYLAKEGQEAVLSIKQRSWDELVPGTYGVSSSTGSWQFQGSYDITDIFKREITLSDVSTNTKKITTKITWQEDGLQKEVVLERILTYWDRIAQTSGEVQYDVGDAANELFKSGNYVYLAMDNPNQSFSIVDVSNPLSPSLVSSLNFNVSSNDVFVYQGYAYLALNSNKVVIIDARDPLNPQHISTIYTGVTPNAVYVYNNYLYIGLNRHSYSLYIYNVSNPSNPQYYRRYYIGAIVNDIKVLPPYIYMAINYGKGFDFSEDNNFAFVGVDLVSYGFEVYTIPHIRRIARLNINGRGRKVDTDGSVAYTAVFERQNGLAKVDVSNPYSPSLIYSKDIGAEGNGVVEEGSYIYMATENTQGGLYITTK